MAKDIIDLTEVSLKEKTKSYKQQAKEYFQQAQGKNFNLENFNRLWKTNVQHVRRIAKGADQEEMIDTAKEAYYHLTKPVDAYSDRSILDVTYKLGGARGKKKEIVEEFLTGIVGVRTHNFRSKWGKTMIKWNGEEHKINTWYKRMSEGKISKDNFYDIINTFKKTNPKYSGKGSK